MITRYDFYELFCANKIGELLCYMSIAIFEMIQSYISIHSLICFCIILLKKRRVLIMLKRFLAKIRFSFLKEIILVDSENIGYQIPEKFPRRTLVYLFISDPYIDDKLKSYRNSKNIKLVDISQIRSECFTKNIMDFCIVAQLAEILPLVFKKTKVVICSKDRGYDASILFLKEKYSHIQIERYPGAFCYYYGNENIDYIEIMKKADDSLKNKILKHTSMESLKPSLRKQQKKMFVIEEYINLVGMVKTFIEFDIYHMSYQVYYSGKLIQSFTNREEALALYRQCINKLHNIYDKYQTHERFLKSRQLNIRHYVEEASLQNQPLEECLIHHLGKEQGVALYLQYVN